MISVNASCRWSSSLTPTFLLWFMLHCTLSDSKHSLVLLCMRLPLWTLGWTSHPPFNVVTLYNFALSAGATKAVRRHDLLPPTGERVQHPSYLHHVAHLFLYAGLNARHWHIQTWNHLCCTWLNIWMGHPGWQPWLAGIHPLSQRAWTADQLVGSSGCLNLDEGGKYIYMLLRSKHLLGCDVH